MPTMIARPYDTFMRISGATAALQKQSVQKLAVCDFYAFRDSCGWVVLPVDGRS
jgi:hypothetical protein